MGSNEGSTLEGQVRAVLLNDWDPIGVAEFQEASDEYDGYVGPVCRLLAGGCSVDGLFEFLWGVETEHMGLPGDRSATMMVARKLSCLGT